MNRRGLWGVMRGRGSEERRKRKRDGSTGQEPREEEQYLEKQQAGAGVAPRYANMVPGAAPLPLPSFHFQLGFLLASLLRSAASLNLLSTSAWTRRGRRVRGLDSAPQG